MNITEKKKYILYTLFTALCLVLSVSLIYIATKIIPKSITYTASIPENSVSVKESEYPKSDICSYEDVYSITESGPYRISAEGDVIYVFSGHKRLYRIKANLSQFPSSDKEAIVSGIETDDKAFLYEIVEYMES
ncbi:MAG: hypothetical protein IJW06_01625 [Clostridia bacterium]|nr:hypothetical protein [Clostridia bacterium]